MAEKTWKHTERRIAAILGGQRVPVTGRGRGDQPDIRHNWLCPEVKHRQIVPGWLLEAIAQATAAAKDQQLPVAIVHKHGTRHRDDLVVLKLSDFLDWFGGPDNLKGDTIHE